MTVEAVLIPAEQAPPAKVARTRMSLAMKFALAFIGLVTLVLVVNGAVNVWLSYQEAKSAAVQVQREKAQAAAERIDLFISGIEQQMGWTTRAEWARVTVEQRRYDFIRLLRQAPAITELIHIGGDGKEQLKLSRLEPDAVGSGADYSGDPRFAGALASKTWFGPVTFRRGSEPYMTIAVSHAGRMPGVTIAEVNLKLIWDVVTSIKVGEGGYAFIVDANGRLVAHPDMSLVLRETDMAAVPKIAKDLARKISSGKNLPGRDIEVSTSLDGKSVLLASAPIARLKWFVFVQLPLSEALAPVYNALGQTGALLGLGIVLASVMGGLLANRMVVPIQRLQAGAERLGAGDLDQRIDIKTGDEIETLGERFNDMAVRLRESYATLEAKVEERTRDLEESLAQQTATADVLKVISRSAFDLQSVLDTLARSACELAGANHSVIYFSRDDAVHAVATFGCTSAFVEFMARTTQKPGQGTAAGRVFLTGEVVIIPDVEADPDYNFGKGPKLGNFRAVLGVPLFREGRVEGAFVFCFLQPGAFSQRQIELTQTFADQAVIAIENSRLFEEVQAKTRDLSEALQQQTATSDILRVISQSPTDARPVFRNIVQTAARLMGCERAFVMLADGESWWNEAAATPEGLSVTYLNSKYPIDASLNFPSRAIISKQLVYLPDWSLLDLPDHQRRVQELTGACSSVHLPFLRGDECIGLLTLTSRRVNPFGPTEITQAESFRDQAMIAIENARLFEEVQTRTSELSASLNDLRATQDRLIQSEKLASLGQLTAGIAHEIKNPLNFINNFSSLSVELLQELQELLASAPIADARREEISDLSRMLSGNLEKVVQHGKRADSIVKNMLLHSREGSGDHRFVGVNALVEESLNLAYHGARAEQPGFNVTIEKRFDPEAGEADLYPQEITRVLLNLISNGFYATAKRKDTEAGAFAPTLSVETEGRRNKVSIKIRDNGTGIPDSVKAKMFNPFFTTKPAGEGTGLGLSLSHDIIVKQHGGTLEVDTELGAYTQFTITLPRKGISGSAEAGASS